MESLWINLWKLKWGLIDPYKKFFPQKYGSLLTLLTVHCIFELVNWNMTSYKLFNFFLIIPWCCKLLNLILVKNNFSIRRYKSMFQKVQFSLYFLYSVLFCKIKLLK